MNVENAIDKGTQLAIEYGPRLIIALVVWIVGNSIIRVLKKGLKKGLSKSKTDETLKPFFIALVGTGLKVLLAISVLSTLGIEMTSFIAILGAVGLAIGMALSGTLQNFAGGVMLLTFKPFKIGDIIEAQGYVGTVDEIQLFNTTLKTPDNKTIIIPNGGLSTSALINFSTEKTRRVDWTFGVGYGEKAQIAHDTIKHLCEQDPRILKDPELFIGLSELADSSVNFVVRAWVKAEDYWGVYFDMNKSIYEEFTKQGINIPFPQLEVHLNQPE